MIDPVDPFQAPTTERRRNPASFAEARMYQNLHGRFTAVDPLLASGKNSNPQTFNRYVYVMNNPLVFTDPSGLQVALWRLYRKIEILIELYYEQ